MSPSCFKVVITPSLFTPKLSIVCAAFSKSSFVKGVAAAKSLIWLSTSAAFCSSPTSTRKAVLVISACAPSLVMAPIPAPMMV